MFRRLVLENWMAVFTLTAFVTALTVYLCCAWRALRMRPVQRERFARMPLED
mgnify:CR=1 FL=1|jgi:hypothetical protein